MANIYLRVPSYVAQLFRGMHRPQPLSEFEPVEFVNFRKEYFLMENHLRLVNETEQTSSWCYSQRAWQNILRGKSPTGGPVILQRDKTEWPTMLEVCMLMGEKKVQKLEGYDYLCIQMPTEVNIGGELRRTNASYSLHPKEAMMLMRYMRDWYKFIFLDYVLKDRAYCNSLNLQRPIGVTIERFFERYYIYIGRDKKERDSMYRMSRRWIEDAQSLPNDSAEFCDMDFDFRWVDEREKKKCKRLDLDAELADAIEKERANKCKSKR